jgi:hypothetical protein
MTLAITLYFSAFQQASVACAASIGQHTRHVLDHFSCLCASLRSDSVVRYDIRARDTATQRDRYEAIKVAIELQLQISELSDQRLEDQVLACCHALNTILNAHLPSSVWPLCSVKGGTRRNLILQLHVNYRFVHIMVSQCSTLFYPTFQHVCLFTAVHHQATIALVAHEIGTALPEGFGKSPSTRHFEAGQQE